MKQKQIRFFSKLLMITWNKIISAGASLCDFYTKLCVSYASFILIINANIHVYILAEFLKFRVLVRVFTFNIMETSSATVFASLVKLNKAACLMMVCGAVY